MYISNSVVLGQFCCTGPVLLYWACSAVLGQFYFAGPFCCTGMAYLAGQFCCTRPVPLYCFGSGPVLLYSASSAVLGLFCCTGPLQLNGPVLVYRAIILRHLGQFSCIDLFCKIGQVHLICEVRFTDQNSAVPFHCACRSASPAAAYLRVSL